MRRKQVNKQLIETILGDGQKTLMKQGFIKSPFKNSWWGTEGQLAIFEFAKLERDHLYLLDVSLILENSQIDLEYSEFRLWQNSRIEDLVDLKCGFLRHQPYSKNWESWIEFYNIPFLYFVKRRNIENIKITEDKLNAKMDSLKNRMMNHLSDMDSVSKEWREKHEIAYVDQEQFRAT